MSDLEAVILDLDGTLVDSERDGHRVAFNEAFEEAGLTDYWDVDTYGRLLKITGGARRLAFWFEQNGRSPEQAAELAQRLHERDPPVRNEVLKGVGAQYFQGLLNGRSCDAP